METLITVMVTSNEHKS